MIPRKSCQVTLEEWHDWIYYQKINKKKIKKTTKGVVVVFPASRKGLKSYSHVKNRAGD
jgi:hypothetical protein